MKRSPLKKYSKAEIPKLKRKTWQIFSLWIRERDKYTCFTCGRKGEGSGIHAGHYVGRNGHNATYFDELNVHAQCYRCNIHLSGNAGEYALRLDEKFGEGTAKKLALKARESHQFSVEELLNIISKYE